jgi:hypothetical protein
VKTALAEDFMGYIYLFIYIYKPYTKLHTVLLEAFIDSFFATCRCQNFAVKEGNFEGGGGLIGHLLIQTKS